MPSNDAILGSVDFFVLPQSIENWALCRGDLLPIMQNPALFSLAGIAFGGDGRTTFALPDLQGRVPVGAGTSGASNQEYVVGQEGGSETHTLRLTEMPQHTHPVALGPATPGAAGSVAASPGGAAANAPAAGTVLPAGGNQPFSILQPYLALPAVICIEGAFPQLD